MIREAFREVRLFFTKNGIGIYLYFTVVLVISLTPELLGFDLAKDIQRFGYLYRALFRIATLFSLVVLFSIYFDRVLVKIVSILVLGLVALNLGVLSACRHIWHTEVSASEVIAVLNTNLAEVSGTIRMVLPFGLISVVYYALTIVVLRWGHRVLRCARHGGVAKIFAFILLGITLFLSLLSCMIVRHRSEDFFVWRKCWHTTPLYTAEAVLNAFDIMNRLDIVRELGENVPPPVVLPNSTRNVVLILGESARRDALSLYGLQYQTSPFAEAREASMLVYDSAVAPSHSTLFAVPPLLCVTPIVPAIAPDDMAYNIINLANLTDVWETYWISNQGKFGVFDSEIGIIAEFAHHQSWVVQSWQYDEVLLPYLDTVLRDGSAKRFIVLHLVGSHMLAKERYPERFAQFELSDQELSNYYNSILYTDYIIEEVVRRVEDEASVVIYVSDHAQERIGKKFLHGLSKKGLEVPFYIWHSLSVDSVFRRSGHIADPISTDVLFETLKFYLGLQTTRSKPKNVDLLVRSADKVVPYEALPEGK